MKYRTIWMLLLALAVAASAYPSAVTEVTLDQRDDGVVARITVDGSVRFVHQVEGPKDGKPYRVIVDVLAAVHQLGKQSFLSLPNDCPVRSLRTSQYAVTPEKICRLVFDMKGAPLYKINKVNNTIEVFFTDKEARPFKTWSTKQFVKSTPTPGTAKAKPMKVAVKPAEQPIPTSTEATDVNETIQKDRAGSLAAKSEQPAAKPSRTPSRSVARTDQKADVKKPSTSTKPEPSKAAATTAAVQGPPAPKAAPAEQVKPVAEKVKATPVPTRVAKKADKPSKTTVAAGPEVTKPKATETKATKPEATKPRATKPKAIKPKATKPSRAEAKPAAPKSKVVATTEPKVGEKTEKPEKKATPKAAPETTKKVTTASKPSKPSSSKKTSRFRRSPEQSKLRGTMVAQFPQRLVVKYKARNTRDPFKTLIDDSKVDNSPLTRRVPNVEGLRLVGIIEDADGANQALFEDVDGYSYILKSGDKVKRGYVLRVETDRVYFQIFEYGWSRTLALHIEEE